MRLEVRKPRELESSQSASRSDTGLRMQTGEGEAFTGGGMFFPPLFRSYFGVFYTLSEESDSKVRRLPLLHRLKSRLTRVWDFPEASPVL